MLGTDTFGSSLTRSSAKRRAVWSHALGRESSLVFRQWRVEGCWVCYLPLNGAEIAICEPHTSPLARIRSIISAPMCRRKNCIAEGYE